jgi:hypothetical protein
MSGPEQSFSFTLASFYRWLESVGEAVLLVVLTLEISGGLPAQGTWVVDNQGRPGSHFLDIPPAVQAAAPNKQSSCGGVTTLAVSSTSLSGWSAYATQQEHGRRIHAC